MLHLLSLAFLQTSNLSTFEWAYQHVMLIGWPVIFGVAWKASKYIEQLSTQASKTVGQIDKMATNCFPTMQRSLENQDGLLHSMDTSLKTIADNSRRRREDF